MIMITCLIFLIYNYVIVIYRSSYHFIIMNIILDEPETIRDGMKAFMSKYNTYSPKKEYITNGASGMGWEITNDSPGTPYRQLSQDGTLEKCTKIFWKVMPMLPTPDEYDPTIDEYHEDYDDNFSLLPKRMRLDLKDGRFVRSSFKFELDEERDLHTEIFKKSNNYLDPICPPLVYSGIYDNDKSHIIANWLNHPNINNMFKKNPKLGMGIIAMGYTTDYITMFNCINNLEDTPKGKELGKRYKMMAAFKLIQLYDLGYVHNDYSLSNILINTKKQYSNSNKKRKYPGSADNISLPEPPNAVAEPGVSADVMSPIPPPPPTLNEDNEVNDLLPHMLLIDFGWTQKHSITVKDTDTNSFKLRNIIKHNMAFGVSQTNYIWLKDLTMKISAREIEETLNSIRTNVERHNENAYKKLEEDHSEIVANIKKYNESGKKDSTLRGGMKRRRKRAKKTKKRTKKQRRASINRKKKKRKTRRVSRH